ncbi:MAG: non-heme iron oxygenase ferredoxin subunit [Candidatus Eisenbacteria bacterium]
MTAETFVPVARVSEIPVGETRVVRAGGERIVLCNVEGSIYAIEDVCTHDGSPFGIEILDGPVIECPRHGAQFDVRSGAVVRLPAVVPVRTFPVKVDEEGSILVGIEDDDDEDEED